jgi:putative peptidoglycan lipid II flippase
VVVVGPVMLVAYFFLLKLFRVAELRDLLRPLLGRLGRGGPAVPAAEGGAPPSSAPEGTPSVEGASAEARMHRPERATTSVDTGLIPRISGEFDAVSFRAGPEPERTAGGANSHDGGPQEKSDGGYLPGEDQPGTARGGLLREQIPLPGRRTFQGKAGENPYFKQRRRRRK